VAEGEEGAKWCKNLAAGGKTLIISGSNQDYAKNWTRDMRTGKSKNMWNMVCISLSRLSQNLKTNVATWARVLDFKRYQATMRGMGTAGKKV